MKKSEFKEYLKNEVLKMTEASDEDIAKQKELNAELEKTKSLMADMTEGEGSTVTISKKDMDKLHSDGEIEVDDHTIKFDMKEGRMKKSEFKEYLYEIEGLEDFNTFAIKIVLQSIDSANPPLVENFRAIALST